MEVNKASFNNLETHGSLTFNGLKADNLRIYGGAKGNSLKVNDLLVHGGFKEKISLSQITQKSMVV
ncbi:MAG UNVERIFIED_CONTAM: hypothetical protein LVQ98_07725 [Rickettsiaceae bacterium]|jgi:hypothetical protein